MTNKMFKCINIAEVCLGIEAIACAIILGLLIAASMWGAMKFPITIAAVVALEAIGGAVRLAVLDTVKYYTKKEEL